MKGAMGKLYQKFLWVIGAAITDEELDECRAAGGDKVTFWHRRSKKRLGGSWWAAVVVTLVAINIYVIFLIKDKRWGWASVIILFDLFSIWFIPHVLGYTILF